MKLFAAMLGAMMLFGCSIHVHEGSGYGYGMYQSYRYGYTYATPVVYYQPRYYPHQPAMVHQCANLNPNVCRARGW